MISDNYTIIFAVNSDRITTIKKEKPITVSPKFSTTHTRQKYQKYRKQSLGLVQTKQLPYIKPNWINCWINRINDISEIIGLGKIF